MEKYGKRYGDYFAASGDETLHLFETREELDAWKNRRPGPNVLFTGRMSRLVRVDKDSNEFFNTHCLDCETPAGYYCAPGCPSLKGVEPKEGDWRA